MSKRIKKVLRRLSRTVVVIFDIDGDEVKAEISHNELDRQIIREKILYGSHGQDQLSSSVCVEALLEDLEQLAYEAGCNDSSE